MKITIESTTKMIEFNGVNVRIWEGHTESGIPVHCYIASIAAPAEGHSLEEFNRELTEHAAPSPAIEAIPLRMIL